MKPTMTQVFAAKASAVQRYASVAGVEGFGVGDGVLRIYVQSPRVRAALPDEIDGVPVEAVVTGDIAASSGD